VWLGESGVFDPVAGREPDHKVERWCNRVAAELLVPLDALRAEYKPASPLPAEIERLARRFKVSTLVILRRIHDAGGLSWDALWDAYEAELARILARPSGSGGNFHPTTAARVSKRFARALVISTWEGRSSFTEAFSLLGIKKVETFRGLDERRRALETLRRWLATSISNEICASQREEHELTRATIDDRHGQLDAKVTRIAAFLERGGKKLDGFHRRRAGEPMIRT
jgi:hypothetical protein